MITKSGEELVSSANNRNDVKRWKGITNAGAKFVKEAASFQPVRNILVRAAKLLNGDDLRAIKNTASGHDHYVNNVIDELERSKLLNPPKENPTFRIGEKGDTKFIGDKELVRHVAERRIGKDLTVDTGINLTPEQLDELIINSFTDNKSGLFKGFSFDSKTAKNLFGEGGKFHGIQNKKNAVYDYFAKNSYSDAYNTYLSISKKLGMPATPEGFKLFCSRNKLDMYNPGMPHGLGMNDIWFHSAPQASDAFLVSHPTADGKSNLVKTLYNKGLYEMRKDINSGRAVNLFDANGNPFSTN